MKTIRITNKTYSILKSWVMDLRATDQKYGIKPHDTISKEADFALKEYMGVRP